MQVFCNKTAYRKTFILSPFPKNLRLFLSERERDVHDVESCRFPAGAFSFSAPISIIHAFMIENSA